MRLPYRFLTLFAATAGAAPALAQPAAVQTAEEALAQDAADYSKRQGVSVEEGARRLRAQAESVAITDQLRSLYATRLAGIAIEHQPVFRIRVLLTGDAPVADRLISAGGMQVPIVFQTGARATGDQVLAAIYRHRDAIGRILTHDGLGHDPRTGTMVVMADRVDLGGVSPEQMAARIEAVAGVPVRIRILDRPSSDLSLTGGGRVEGENPSDGKRYFCTTGYVVTDGRRGGIVTAAHCPDRLDFHGAGDARVPLEFVGGWGSQFQDVQVHVGGAEHRPVFRAGDALRPQIGQRQRARTRTGETVCHRGESSGYSCGEVDLVDYAPPGTLCGGLCHPTWVTVTGPGCRNGDSGGPVFVGATAFGILKGGNYAADGRCNFYYYMSTDYLPPGWSLMLADAAAEPAQSPQSR